MSRDPHAAPDGMSRRRLLVGTAWAAGAWALGRAGAAGSPATTDLEGLDVLPRSAWAAGLAVTEGLALEPEVRYLIVHHSVDPGNAYGPDDVAEVLRGFHRVHTGPAKGWPDVAYNFFVDRFGRVWEGRAWSLDAPVAGDATGGNQGSDQLCCFVGNHQQAEPTPAAFAAMGRLLGALGRRYRLALGPEAATSFVSRGSNRHPPGTEVTTNTVAAHRDMSRTQCPGDFVVARLPELRLLAAGGAAAVAPAPIVAGPDTTPPPATVTTAPAGAAATGPTGPTGSTGAAGTAGTADGAVPPLVAGGAALAATAVAAATWARSRRPGPPPPHDPG
ncbi:MAG TPA: N-acetylmuramoyl-L-alanine amidase [Acidimicrobiales bacterium]|nr:N-acetylmuramoyl-L-alanine amidase [Acidimicrobiales bacterium]